MSVAPPIVLPRPNLGPEPWPEPSPWPVAIGWLAFGLILALAFITWKIRRSPRAGGIAPGESQGPRVDPDETPRQRLIALSETVRGGLIAEFGPAWGSKTTEEIGQEPDLIGRLEPVEVDRLVEFLKLADRVKFASAEPESVEDWEPWASGFVSGLAAGATSRSNGR